MATERLGENTVIGVAALRILLRLGGKVPAQVVLTALTTPRVAARLGVTPENLETVLQALLDNSFLKSYGAGPGQVLELEITPEGKQVVLEYERANKGARELN